MSERLSITDICLYQFEVAIILWLFQGPELVLPIVISYCLFILCACNQLPLKCIPHLLLLIILISYPSAWILVHIIMME